MPGTRPAGPGARIPQQLAALALALALWAAWRVSARAPARLAPAESRPAAQRPAPAP